MVTVAGCNAGFVQSDYYEEDYTYFFNPKCKPSKLDKGIECSAVTNPIVVGGGLVNISLSLLFNKIIISLVSKLFSEPLMLLIIVY